MLAMSESFNVPDDDTTSQEAAFVSAVTHSESPGTTLLLAEAIEDQIDRHTADMGVQRVIVDTSELLGMYDQHTIETALKLSGCFEGVRQGGSGVIWSTTKNPKLTLPVIRISGDVLKEWLADD
jgi:hypothetical protein